MYRLCPRDFSALSPHEWRTTKYLLCDTCHGVLVEPTEVKKLVRSGGQPPLQEPPDEPLFQDGSALCSCSGVPMNTVTREGVRVDVCPACRAIWFDGGELQRLIEAKRETSPLPDRPAGEEPYRGESWKAFEVLGAILEDLLRIWF